MFFEIGGEKKELKLTTNGMREVEKYLRKLYPECVVMEELQKPGFEAMTLQLWAAMLKNDRSATIDQAGDLADLIGFSRLAEEIIPALQIEFFPDVTNEDTADTAGN